MKIREAERKDIEEWSRLRTELASDTNIDNTASIIVHKYLGFKESERVVCFIKKLNA